MSTNPNSHETPTRGPLDGVADTTLFDTAQVAALRVWGSVPKLTADRAQKRGPAWFKLGGRVFYQAGALRAYLASAIAKASEAA